MFIVTCKRETISKCSLTKLTSSLILHCAVNIHLTKRTYLIMYVVLSVLVARCKRETESKWSPTKPMSS